MCTPGRSDALTLRYSCFIPADPRLMKSNSPLLSPEGFGDSGPSGTRRCPEVPEQPGRRAWAERQTSAVVPGLCIGIGRGGEGPRAKENLL